MSTLGKKNLPSTMHRLMHRALHHIISIFQICTTLPLSFCTQTTLEQLASSPSASIPSLLPFQTVPSPQVRCLYLKLAHMHTNFGLASAFMHSQWECEALCNPKLLAAEGSVQNGCRPHPACRSLRRWSDNVRDPIDTPPNLAQHYVSSYLPSPTSQPSIDCLSLHLLSQPANLLPNVHLTLPAQSIILVPQFSCLLAHSHHSCHTL